MQNKINEIIREVCKCQSIISKQHIQGLWNGYGSLDRYYIDNYKDASIIVKQIELKKTGNHPRGWDSNASHLRKLKSYEIEINWYTNWVKEKIYNFKIPALIGKKQIGDTIVLILEDLTCRGYTKTPSSINWSSIKLCIEWLAKFHAQFLNTKQSDLWEIGSYWHLSTRQDELEAMGSGELKNYAKKIDQILNNCRYQTLVHGDAKLANFCFSESLNKVAAVDFQYVGSGCGMKDLAYFVSSCMYEEDCEIYEKEILDSYFNYLRKFVGSSISFEELKHEWTNMYYFAWADFYRFLKGWSPDHWKINSYNEKVTEMVIDKIKRGEV